MIILLNHKSIVSLKLKNNLVNKDLVGKTSKIFGSSNQIHHFRKSKIQIHQKILTEVKFKLNPTLSTTRRR